MSVNAILNGQSTPLEPYTSADIQNLWDSAVILVNFKITDTSEFNSQPPTGQFVAPRGMTIEEWLNSNYNQGIPPEWEDDMGTLVLAGPNKITEGSEFWWQV